MTVAIAIRTGSAVVFAADSKLTTQALGGIEEDGTLRWQDQTYDHFVKIVHDRGRRLMAMAAGSVNIGQMSATDYISTREHPYQENAESQDRTVTELIGHMNGMRQAYWSTTKVPPENWPGPILLLATASPDGITPRIWRVTMHGPDPQIDNILQEPGIKIEGSYDEVFMLLYGFDLALLEDFTKQLGHEAGKMWEALKKLKVLRPIDKLNLASMPIQDAINLAVFLASVQVEMDRFLPGPKACGGPIDVMVLRTAPLPEILTYPGKTLHHPQSG